MNFVDSWHALLKLAYKWATLPLVLLVFFGGQGWDALRIAQGYAETTGVITHYSCGKAVVVQFEYTAGDVVHRGSSASALSSFECPQYNPGEAVRIFYSTRNPDMALMNATPQQALRHQFAIILVMLLLFPFATFCLAYRMIWR